jgi:DNA-directed RNA polymerase subunit RPC12/RpoP
MGGNMMRKRKMLTDCPDLMAQWDYRKNKDAPKNFTAGSGYLAWWLCEKGHSWQATINHRNHGSGCPVCASRVLVKGVNDLATLNPNLAAEWNYEKNGGLTPGDVPNGTHRKVWWRCSKGHEWEAQIISRIRGCGCPCCSGRAVVKGETDLATVRPDLATQFDIAKNNGLSPSDICFSSNKKYWWLCELGHSWKASANTRQKSSCPVCAGRKVEAGFNDLFSLKPTLAAQWDYSKNTLKPTEVTLGSGRFVWWICDKGHSWETRVADRQQGSGCPYCSGHLAIPGETDLATVKPELLAEWDYAKNDNIKPEQIASQSNMYVWWKCKFGHSWCAPVSRRYIGRGCPVCAGLIAVKGFNDLQSHFPHIAKQWDFSKNRKKPDEFTAYSNKYAWWVCEKGHSWKALINNRTSKGRGCPYCSGFLAIPGETDLLTLFPVLATEWDYDKNTANIRTTTAGTPKKVWWKCKSGHSWKASVKSRSSLGRGCPYCAGMKAIPGETDLLTVAPHIAKEWDYARNTVDITTITLKSNVRAWWLCEHGHSWDTFVYTRAVGAGCPYCAGQKAIPGETDLLTIAPHFAKQWDYEQNTVDIETLTFKSNVKVWWVCEHGHKWKASVASRTDGNGCPICSGRIIYKPKNVKG